jgi:hypothetical protein
VYALTRTSTSAPRQFADRLGDQPVVADLADLGVGDGELVVLGLFAVLAATGFCLSAVSLLNRARAPQSSTTAFSLWVFLGHVVLGVVGPLPFRAMPIYPDFGGATPTRHRRRPPAHLPARRALTRSPCMLSP